MQKWLLLYAITSLICLFICRISTTCEWSVNIIAKHGVVTLAATEFTKYRPMKWLFLQLKYPDRHDIVMYRNVMCMSRLLQSDPYGVLHQTYCAVHKAEY